MNGLSKHVLKLKNGLNLSKNNRRKSLENNFEDEVCKRALVKTLAQNINEHNGDFSSLEGSPMMSPRAAVLMSPRALMNTLVDDLNSLEETKAEIQKRLNSFTHIKESHFMCARYFILWIKF